MWKFRIDRAKSGKNGPRTRMFFACRLKGALRQTNFEHSYVYVVHCDERLKIRRPAKVQTMRSGSDSLQRATMAPMAASAPFSCEVSQEAIMGQMVRFRWPKEGRERKKERPAMKRRETLANEHPQTSPSLSIKLQMACEPCSIIEKSIYRRIPLSLP